MVVVAIIGVLAAVALPTYSAFLTRSKLVEGINLPASCMILLDIFATGDTDLTGAEGNAICDTTVMQTEHFITQPIVVQSRSIVVIRVTLSPTFGSGLSNTQFGWWKDYSQPAPRWICGGTPQVNTSPDLEEYLPSSCHG